jgi:hypothetical protein
MFPWPDVLRIHLEWTWRAVLALTPGMLPWVLLIGVPAGLLIAVLAEIGWARRLRVLARYGGPWENTRRRRWTTPAPFSASEGTDAPQLPETVGPQRHDPGLSGTELFGPPLTKRERPPE